MRRVQWDKRVTCAIAPMAFGMFFDLPDEPETTLHGDVAVVRVQGPLTHHRELWWDSYDAILSRVAGALEAKGLRALVLAIDSPGGYVSGCFETATEIRDLCAARGVELHAYVDGCVASAAYALASVAKTITVPTTGTVGSVGVITTLYDITKMNAEFGVNVELIASGERKTDGNPNVPISDEAKSVARGHVLELAEVFFQHVAAGRPQLDVAKLRALRAGVVVTGASAVREGLADRVDTLKGLLASLARGSLSAPRAQEGNGTMDSVEEARAALQAVIDDETLEQDVRDRAKDALAVLNGEASVASSDDEASAQLAALTAVNEALTAELAALRSIQPSAEQARESAACAAVDEAIADGRIAASARDAWLKSARANLSTFKKTVAAMPKGASLGGLTARVTSSTPSKGAPAPKTEAPKAAASDEEEAKRLLERAGHKSAIAHVKA